MHALPSHALQMRRISSSMEQLEAATLALHGSSVPPQLLAQVRAAAAALCCVPAVASRGWACYLAAAVLALHMCRALLEKLAMHNVFTSSHLPPLLIVITAAARPHAAAAAGHPAHGQHQGVPHAAGGSRASWVCVEQLCELWQGPHPAVVCQVATLVHNSTATLLTHSCRRACAACAASSCSSSCPCSSAPTGAGCTCRPTLPSPSSSAYWWAHCSLVWVAGWMGGWVDGWSGGWVDGWSGAVCLLSKSDDMPRNGVGLLF